MAADATESDDSPSPSASRPVSRTASERKKKAPKRRPAEPARPAKVALLVWKISCSLLSRAAKRTQRKALQEALGRLAAQHLVKKVLATVAQWERHALKNCNWRGEGDAKPAQTNLHLGVGWWELPELENYPVSVADATAAMLHAIQFGGSKEYGGAIGDLSSFVKEYVGSCRLTCVIKRYTFEEKKARFQHRDELRQAFEEQEEARGNFEERAKVIASTLVQKHADLKTFDALHHLATQRDKNFDVHISNSKTICDGYLSLQNVHVYQALGRIYPRLLALEKELEDTIQSVTGLADPGAEPEAIEEEEGLEDIKKEEESPRARARRRKETMRRRKALLEQQRVNKGPGEEADQVSNSRPALRFEDKAAHDKQLAALKEKFDRVLLEYDLVPDADKSRIAHLYTLANQGQQKLDQYQDQLQKAEEDIEVLAHRTKEALRAESEKKCWEMLRSGRLPTEMLGSLKKQSIDGPTPDDRDALKARTAALFSQIADRQKTTAEERDLQEELESLQQEIQEQEAVRVVEETQEAERIQTESVELPSLDAAFSPLRSSMEVCKRAMELASVEFVQLTTGATKLERKAEAVAGSMASLLEGRPSEQVKAQVNEWQALCQDLLLDMEQVADSVKVDGLPKGIADKVWMQKQAEIRGASRKKQEEAVEEKPKEKTSKKAAKQNAVTAKKQEMKIEKEMQDQALRKKQIMLGIEMLWSQLPENEVAADAVSSHGSSMVPSPASPASPAGAGPSRAARPTLQTQKSKNQLNPVSPLERILQHHRADFAAGHERRNSLVKQIEELQQKLEELSPEAQEVLKKAEQGIAERKAAQAANRALSPGGSAPPSPRAKSKPAERRATKSRASILQVGTNGAEEDDGAMSDDSDPDEAPEPMRLDPWMLAFPTDTPELGKKKWEFCKANRIKPHHLHDASRHKKYIFALRRMMKQCKRTLALKQKLLMKFLSGDALQKFKVQMQKTPQELEAEVDHEGRKLKERDAMIAKLLTFWHRRMQQLEDEKEAERETFRYKVKALLEDIQSLAKVLEDAALTKKRRRRVDADDLLTLRQQKAATAAAEAMRPRTSRAGEGNADIARFQAMMSQRSRRRQSVDQQAAEGVHRQEEKQERKKLAELLRKHLAQHRKSFEEENADKAEASDHSSSGSSKSSEEAREGDQLPGQHISDPRGDAQEGDAGASSEGFVLMRRRKHSLKEPPVQTLSSLPMLAGVQTVEGGRHRASVAGIRMFGRPSSRMRGTAKRKSSVARKDSIFENPAAMSRRLTDDSARSAALAQVLQMAQASDAASADDDASKVMQAASERIRRKSQEEALLKAQLAGAGPAQAVALKPLQAPTDLPGAVSFHGHAFGRRSSQRPGTRKHEDGESKRRKDSETPTPFVLGLRGTGSSQPGSRAASPEDSGPPSMATSRPPAKTRSASRIYQGRPSAAGLTLPLARAEDGGRTGGGKPGKRTKSPDHSRRSSGASEYDGDTGNEVSEEEMRADLFLKATYLHLGAFRQHYLHPSLKGQRPALSDAIMGENGEALFRSLIAQIVDLPSEMLRRAVRHFINTERARCLFIVKNSLIHQARLELEASQRTISILESDPNEVERQMKEGGPLFPALKKAKDSVATAKDTKPSPSPPESSSDSSSDEEPEKPAGGISPPSTQAQAVHRASIRGKLRRAGVHSFMAFAEGLHQLNRRPTRDQAIPGASDEMGVPMLQIRSVDGPRPHVAMDAAANEAPDQSATKTGSIKKRIGGSKTSTTLSERLREAQLAADAASSSRQGSQNASEKPPTSAMSLQTSMLKTMLKKPAVQDSKKQSSTMSLIGDYNWDKTLKKFDTLLRRGGLQNRSANQGYWESHFAYDVGPDGPLSSRLPDSEGRPLSAPGCRPIKHRPQPIKEEVEKTDESPGGSSPSKSPSIPPATPVDTEQPPAEPEEGGEKRASKNTPLLLSLARFMTKVKAKKSKREKLEEFFYVAEQKAKWSRRPSKPRLLTQEMEEEWAELQDKVRMEKGKWIQHSRRKVEAMFQEEEFGENWDRQQRTLQRERNPRQQDNIFDTLSFVRWKVNRQLRQAMQDVEKGNKVNLPRKQDRSAGPPPPDPVWIVGDREDSGLEKARERIATLRAKKYRGKPFMPMGQGRGWRVDQDLFDHVDELFQQYGEPAAINEDAVTTRAASEMVGAKQKERRASDSDSESGHSDSSSALQRRVVSAPASMRRVQARRITRSRAKSRELSVLPPWMRQMLVQDDIWQQLPESSPWDRTCWLQPVRVKGRTATDRAMTPEQVAKALSRKSSRSDKPRRVAEDPVLFVRKACRSIVEEYAEKAPEDAAPTLKPEEPTRPGSPVSPDTETRHNRVMEILERDSLLTQEPLERVLEEDEEESGTGSINMSVFAEAAGAGLGPAHAEGDGLSKPSSSKDRLAQEIYTITSRPAKRQPPALSMQTLVFEMPSKEPTGTKGHRCGDVTHSLSTDASTESISSQDKAKAKPQRRPRGIGSPQRHKRDHTMARRRKHSELDVVARKMVDLSLLENIGTEHRRRSLLHEAPPPSSEPVQAEKPVPAPPQMTVDIGKLSAVLAKQWSEVTAEEVQARRLGMQKLKAAKLAPKATIGETVDVIALESLYEVDKANAAQESEVRQSSKASALSDVSERKASKTNSLGNARMSRLNSMGATAGLSQSLLDVDVELQAEDMAPAALQTHLTQWRSWRREGRLPSAPVHLPPAPIAQHPTKAAPVRQNSGSAAQPPAGLHLDISVPSRAINEYLRDFRDQDLDGVLEGISQTPADDFETNEFVWPPPKRSTERSRGAATAPPAPPATKLPLVQGRGIIENRPSSTGESWVRALTSRADSPAWLLDALDSRASSRTSRSYGDRASPPPDLHADGHADVALTVGLSFTGLCNQRS